MPRNCYERCSAYIITFFFFTACLSYNICDTIAVNHCYFIAAFNIGCNRNSQMTSYHAVSLIAQFVRALLWFRIPFKSVFVHGFYFNCWSWYLHCDVCHHFLFVPHFTYDYSYSYIQYQRFKGFHEHFLREKSQFVICGKSETFSSHTWSQNYMRRAYAHKWYWLCARKGLFLFNGCIW